MGAEKWYRAAAKWDEILKRKDMEYWAQLKPGRPLSTLIYFSFAG
jgi:trimethyllysine dioxygenase